MSKKAKQISTYVVVALGASLILGGIFTVLSMQTFAKVPMVVAARDIEPYSGVIMPEDFKVIEVSKGDKKNFAGFIENSNELIGKVATSPIYEGQPVKGTQFINPDDAQGVQSIVTKEGNRGLYLPMTASNALLGDMKIGGEYDFYIVIESPKPIAGKEDNTETVIVPLQSSYMVNKLIVAEDGTVSVFVEFPEEESERYVMLKGLLSTDKAVLMATMPNAIHEDYEGKKLTYTEFFGALMNDANYFTSVSQDNEVSSDTEINVGNNIQPIQGEDEASSESN